MSYLYARTSRCFSSCRRVISLLFDDDSLVADVIVDAARRLLHALHPSRSSDQPLAGLPISRTTRDKRPRYPSFQPGGMTKEARRTSGSVDHVVRDGRGGGTSDFRPRSSDGADPQQAALHAGISASDPRGRASLLANGDSVTCFVTPADC